MNAAVLGYRDSNNLGDYIQSIAAAYCLEQGPVTVDREQLHDYVGPPVGLIMNGWFMSKPKHWPPAKGITPLFISFHLNPTAMGDMLQAKGIEYLKRHQPIGCRDTHTRALLEGLGIEAYFSGCLTMTLKREYFASKRTERKGILVIGAFDRLLPKFRFSKGPNAHTLVHDLIQTIKYPHKRRNHYLAEKRLNAFLSLNSELVIRRSQIVDIGNTSVQQRIELARQQLHAIARSSYVVTSRIHCALPAAAMEIPVLFLSDGLTHRNHSSRLGGLERFLRVTTSADLPGLTWDDLQPLQAHRPYSTAMQKRIREFFSRSNHSI